MIDLFEKQETCKRCKLYATSHALGEVGICIKGVGPTNGNIMLIGEAPGVQEVLQNKNFVGDSGKVLDECLNEAAINREEVFICNTVRCRPPNNDTPMAFAISACSEYLDEDIRTVKPKVIGLLGKVAICRVLDNVSGGVTTLRGNAIFSKKYNCWCVPMYHPSYVLRNATNLVLRDMLIKDLKLVKEISETDHYMKTNEKVEYTICGTIEKVEERIRLLYQHDKFTFDIETTSLDFWKATMVSISFGYQQGKAFVIPFYKNKVNR